MLLPSVPLPFDAKDMAGATVGDVFADPDRFADVTLADPLEGVAYGRCKAKVMRRSDVSLWINSFAHGHTTYQLKFDAASVKEAADPAGLADLFVRLLIQADVSPEEEQALRDLVTERAGIRARPLAAKIKAPALAN